MQLTALHILGHRPLPARSACAPVRTVLHLATANPAALPAVPKNPGASQSRRARAERMREAVLAYMREAGEPVPRAEIAEELDEDVLVISDRLTELGRMGLVTYTRDGRGVLWALAEAGK